MSTTITAENGAEIEVCRLGISVVHPEGIAKIWARLTGEQRAALAAALAAPPAAGQWTRADLPGEDHLLSRAPIPFLFWREVSPILDRIVTHLNAHHPKPEHPTDPEAARLRRERDTAFRDADHYRQLRNEQFARAEAAERVLRERDEQEDDATRAACERAEQAERDRDEWKARAEAAEARTAPAVSRADIEKVVEAVFAREAGYGLGSDKPWPGTQPVASAVWNYLKGDDPAVYVVRASHIHALTDPEDARHFYLADGQWEFRDPTESDLDHAWDEVESDLRYLIAVRQVREAEQAVDPVEDAAVDAFEAAWHRADEEGDEGNRVRRGIRAARHVLGQEADQ